MSSDWVWPAPRWTSTMRRYPDLKPGDGPMALAVPAMPTATVQVPHPLGHMHPRGALVTEKFPVSPVPALQVIKTNGKRISGILLLLLLGAIQIENVYLIIVFSA